MRMHVRTLAAGATLAAALCFVAGFGGAQGSKAAFKTFLPAEAYKELVARSAKAIDANLASPDEDSLKRAQVHAALIAGYTLSAQAPPGDAAGVRTAALDLATIVTNKAKLNQAKKLASNLAALKGEPGGTAKTDLLAKYPEDVDDLMNLLRTKAKGGEGIAPALQSNLRLKGALNGIEEKIRELGKKKLKAEKVGPESEELALLGYKVAVVAELAELHPAPRKGKGTAKDWHQLAGQMRDAAVDMAGAATKKDAEGIFTAANKLNSSCNQCHSLFR
jgi:hypothetical protein